MVEQSDLAQSGLVQKPSHIRLSGGSEGQRNYSKTELQEYTARCLSRSLLPKALKDFPVGVEDYDSELPRIRSFQNATHFVYFSDAITETIQNTQKDTIRLADIGYGAGLALLQAATQPGWEKLSVYGIGFSHMSRQLFSQSQNGEGVSIYEALLANNVNLIEGSATEVLEMDLPKFDIIVANKSFPYIQYPHFELLKKLYNLLDVGGFIAVNGFYQNYSAEAQGVIDDHDYFGTYGVQDSWRAYFKALETVGCYVDVPANWHPSGDPPQLGEKNKIVVYKGADIPIPNKVGDIKRPNDNYFTGKNAITSFSGSGQSRTPSLLQRAEIELRKRTQRR